MPFFIVESERTRFEAQIRQATTREDAKSDLLSGTTHGLIDVVEEDKDDTVRTTGPFETLEEARKCWEETKSK